MDDSCSVGCCYEPLLEVELVLVADSLGSILAWTCLRMIEDAASSVASFCSHLRPESEDQTQHEDGCEDARELPDVVHA